MMLLNVICATSCWALLFASCCFHSSAACPETREHAAQAEVGFAMGGGVDVASEVAAVVLLGDRPSQVRERCTVARMQCAKTRLNAHPGHALIHSHVDLQSRHMHRCIWPGGGGVTAEPGNVGQDPAKPGVGLCLQRRRHPDCSWRLAASIRHRLHTINRRSVH